MILVKQKTDNIGAIASTLCLLHCVVTPFIFIAQASSVICCDAPPYWWKFMDYFFLAISFFAIYWSTKTTSIKWITPMFWSSWAVLAAVILNEKLELFHLPEAILYIPAIALIILHLYNRKHCKCNVDKCCVNEE
ncbi:MerC domain-containing protein [Cellulophaga sp. HaHaR_3_176]|uniref:MerC domain-containing protein n=1 Tax=Cellulophaga sp. HaHaR_3_176 TaxID=1942464 RepID=UPI001C200BC5|nr:MerC domain-containing protein [Cellulophaga sp. HaHaR_3_176]QWX85171.1 MerC domain-containing protein [Cellulophaga sp. HaHaR_3_176]